MITPVAIAVVAHGGCYLVGHRGPDGPLAGYAEFPGGKCLPSESPESCAVRECLEETGLAVRVVRLRHQTEHTYPYGTVHLHFFDCELVPGTDPTDVPARFGWVPVERLGELQFPEPNHVLIADLVAGRARDARFLASLRASAPG